MLHSLAIIDRARQRLGLHVSIALLCAALAQSAVALAPPPGVAAISFDSANGSFLDGNSRMIGWEFEVASALDVIQLGWHDLGGDGLNVAHEIGIWEEATGTLLGSAVVPNGTGGELHGFFRYIPLGTTLMLAPGVSYVIAGFDPGNGDPHVWDAFVGGYNAHINGFAVDAAVVLGAVGTARGIAAGAFVFPLATIGDSRSALIGPNFQYSAVPVPAALPLLAGGVAVLGWRRRTRPA